MATERGFNTGWKFLIVASLLLNLLSMFNGIRTCQNQMEILDLVEEVMKADTGAGSAGGGT